MRLEQIYQDVILDHYKHPHHRGLREPFGAQVHHVNPTCGDEVTLRYTAPGTGGGRISLGEVTTAGYAAFRNLSTATAGTAYIALGAYVGTNLHEFVQLRRGQPAVFPLTGNVTVGAKAYGSALPLRYIVFAE